MVPLKAFEESLKN